MKSKVWKGLAVVLTIGLVFTSLTFAANPLKAFDELSEEPTTQIIEETTDNSIETEPTEPTEEKEEIIIEEKISQEKPVLKSAGNKSDGKDEQGNNIKIEMSEIPGHSTIILKKQSDESISITVTYKGGVYKYHNKDTNTIQLPEGIYNTYDGELIGTTNISYKNGGEDKNYTGTFTPKEVKPEPVVEYGKYKIIYVDENGVEIKNSFISDDIDISKSPVDISEHIINIDGYDRVGEVPVTVNLEADKTTEIVITYKAKKPEIIEIAVIALGQTPGHSITINRQKGETLSENPMDYDNLTLIVGRYNREPITDSAILNAIKYQLSYTESWNVDGKDFVNITPSGDFKQGPDGKYHVFYESGLIRLGTAPIIEYTVQYKWNGEAPQSAVLPVDTNKYTDKVPPAFPSPCEDITENDYIWHFEGWKIEKDEENHVYIFIGTWSKEKKIPEPIPTPDPDNPKAKPDKEWFGMGDGIVQTGDMGVPEIAALAGLGAVILALLIFFCGRNRRK